MTDIAAVAASVVRAAGRPGRTGRGRCVVVDNTFASPALQRPLELGADVVFHSATKYLAGHSDTICGVAVTNDDAIAERLRFLQNAMGAVPSPFDCFLVLRGLRTLAAPGGAARGQRGGGRRVPRRTRRRGHRVVPGAYRRAAMPIRAPASPPARCASATDPAA